MVKAKGMKEKAKGKGQKANGKSKETGKGESVYVNEFVSTAFLSTLSICWFIYE